MSGSRDYELSPDLREKQVEMLCRKYGGVAAASQAASVIQHAYRRYRLSRSFARMRLEAAASPATTRVDRRLSRGGLDSALAETAAPPPAQRAVAGVRCRVRPRDARTTDLPCSGGRADVADVRRHVVAMHSVSVTSTTTTRQHHKVLVRGARCCANADTTSLTSTDDSAAAATARVVVERAPAAVDVTRSDDELRSVGAGVVLPRTTVSSVDDVDELTDVDDTTLQQLCLTDSSYGEMATADSDVDDPAGPRYVDDDALEADPATTGRWHVYSSLRLCAGSKHSALADPSRTDVPASGSPVWKRQDVSGDASKDATVRCGCGWRGQSAPQLNDVTPAMMMRGTAGSASVSTGSLATIGNCTFSHVSRTSSCKGSHPRRNPSTGRLSGELVSVLANSDSCNIDLIGDHLK